MSFLTARIRTIPLKRGSLLLHNCGIFFPHSGSRLVLRDAGSEWSKIFLNERYFVDLWEKSKSLIKIEIFTSWEPFSWKPFSLVDRKFSVPDRKNAENRLCYHFGDRIIQDSPIKLKMHSVTLLISLFRNIETFFTSSHFFLSLVDRKFVVSHPKPKNPES